MTSACDPGHGRRDPAVFFATATALAREGRIEEAIEADRRALELRPRYVEALSFLTQLKTFAPGDADLQALEALAQDERALEKEELIMLFFALAKAYEDVGDYERSFAHLSRANALKRSTIKGDVDASIRYLSRIGEVFDQRLLDRFAGSGSQSNLPVLIVGMPRSGTTLVEQMLASHGDVWGAGELTDIEEMSVAVSLFSESHIPFPEGVTQLSSEELTRFGNGYVGRLRRAGGANARVTDKMGGNFRFLGLLRLMVPEARVIHCVRDPLDTCFSCYSYDFDAADFAYDLRDLGRYYRAYAQLMDHWRTVLPAGWMLDVSYEDLVADFEHEARRIVAHCGLEWDDSCLAFHTTKRSILTTSFAQVRRPVYRSSVGRWRRYERHLQPLLAALGPDLTTR